VESLLQKVSKPATKYGDPLTINTDWSDAWNARGLAFVPLFVINR
jgi:hypothetical protein